MALCFTRRRTLAALAAGFAWPAAAALAAETVDPALLGELRAGAALLMRHTQTVPGVGDPPGWRLDQCASQRNLDERGIAHARRIGRWFAAQRLVPATVRHSPWCRTRDTARLAFGRGEEWASLANIFDDRSGADARADAVRAFVRAMKAGELAVLVSHGVTIGHIVGGPLGLAPGESVVVRAGASGASTDSGASAAAPLAVLGRLVVP
ncbi:MAG: histidine phosphatase family protein [Burkholderiales bacterium]|nr:histidine phosphatase family protein [Burkholderiales bacterium]